jgi:predicted transcriptional regulator
MPHSPIGDTHEDVVREETERDPAFASAYAETQFEAQAALALAEMREQRQLTQQALAQAAGTSQPMINRLEKAAQTPSITTVWRLMCALDAETIIRPSGITIQPVVSIASQLFPSNAVRIYGPQEGSNLLGVFGYNDEWIYGRVPTELGVGAIVRVLSSSNGVTTQPAESLPESLMAHKRERVLAHAEPVYFGEG